jgi:hypothetical protein
MRGVVSVILPNPVLRSRRRLTASELCRLRDRVERLVSRLKLVRGGGGDVDTSYHRLIASPWCLAMEKTDNSTLSVFTWSLGQLH